jgi:hypothetical protein
MYLFARKTGREIDERKEVKSTSGLILFANYKESRDEKSATLERLKKEAEMFAENTMTDEVKEALEKKHREMDRLSKELNQSRLAGFIVEHAHASFWRRCCIPPAERCNENF